MKAIYVVNLRRTCAILLLCFATQLAAAQVTDPFRQVRVFANERDLFEAHPELQRVIARSKSGLTMSDKDGKNAQEISVSRVPARLSSFILSPDQEHFVAFEVTENQTDDLFFFMSTGKLLSVQCINIYPQISYSSDGEFVIALDQFGRQIYIFTKTGELTFLGDYLVMTNEHNSVLYGALISESGCELLINTSNNVHLIDLTTNQKVFTTRTGKVSSGKYFSVNGKLLLKSVAEPVGDERKAKYNLVVLSRTNGSILKTLPRLSDVLFTKAGFVTFDGSAYTEYVVQ